MKTDKKIQHNIMEELAFNPSIASENIGVSVSEGIVTINGRVASVAEKYAVETACFRVFGVKAIANKLEVDVPQIRVRADADIAKAAADALDWNVILPSGIHVTVENGRLILRGDVDWAYQRIAAENTVKNLKGITDVKNYINIRTKVEAKNVKEKIESALSRMADEDIKKIRVNIHGGKVILSGTVSSRAEIENAQWAAWAVPGVTDIDNRLQIAF